MENHKKEQKSTQRTKNERKMGKIPSTKKKRYPYKAKKETGGISSYTKEQISQKRTATKKNSNKKEQTEKNRHHTKEQTSRTTKKQPARI